MCVRHRKFHLESRLTAGVGAVPRRPLPQHTYDASEFVFSGGVTLRRFSGGHHSRVDPTRQTQFEVNVPVRDRMEEINRVIEGNTERLAVVVEFANAHPGHPGQR